MPLIQLELLVSFLPQICRYTIVGFQEYMSLVAD